MLVCYSNYIQYTHSTVHTDAVVFDTDVVLHMIRIATQRGGIGLAGTLPWPQLKFDMKHFQHITSAVNDVHPNENIDHTNNTSNCTKISNVVIMGRNTWDSLPNKYKPLPNRINIILTSNMNNITQSIKSLNPSIEPNTNGSNVYISSSLDAALELCNTTLSTRINTIHIIGGGELYKSAILHPLCNIIYLTQIFTDYKCDTYMPLIDRKQYELDTMSDIITENNTVYQFHTYKRIHSNNSITSASIPQHDEYQYLNLVRNVIENGNIRTDRTGTGTHSLFGCSMRYNLSDNTFPLLTTKRVFWRGVVEELLWIIRGQTNSRILADKNVHIWDDNGSRAFLDNLGFTNRQDGDLGPVCCSLYKYMHTSDQQKYYHIPTYALYNIDTVQ